MEKENNNKNIQNINKNKKIAIITVIVFATVMLIFFSVYLIWNHNQKRNEEMKTLQEKLENIANQVGGTNLQNSSFPVQNEAEEINESKDEYTGWKTYTNDEIGYKLQYPNDWTIKEIDEYNDTILSQVKYIVISPPDKNFFLHWGIKGKNDSFAVTDRTGIGSGDFKKDGKISILEKETDITRFIFKNKTKEIFYPSISLTATKDDKHYWTASIGPGASSEYDEVDIDNSKIKIVIEKILKSITLVPKTSSSEDCVPDYTDEEKLNIAGWKAFNNSKYSYSLKYPKNWTIKDSESKRVVMEDEDEKIFFSWNSEEMTAFDYMGYHQTGKKNIKLACKNGEITYLAGDAGTESEQTRLLFADFKKDGKRHLITFSYQYLGASISSDMVEMFNLILKSIQFK